LWLAGTRIWLVALLILMPSHALWLPSVLY